MKTKNSEKIFGYSVKPISYSSAPTRYSSLHGFMQGAEFNEVNDSPCAPSYETPNNWQAMNIKSGVNQSDCPSKFGIVRRGTDKIGGKIFTQSMITDGWIRRKGEPVS